MKPGVAAAVALCLLCVGAVAVGAVPDARMTVTDTSVSADRPAVGEPVTVNATVANSGASPSAVDVTSVSVVEDGGTLAEATGPGALSPGDDLAVSLSLAFEEAGERDLRLEAEGEDENGETVTVGVPLSVTVTEAEESIEVSARAGDLASEAEEGGDDLTAILDGGVEEGSEEPSFDAPVTVTVSNPGTVAAERVTVVPSVDGEALARSPVGPLAPGETERVVVDLGTVSEQRAVTVGVEYDLATGPGETETTLTYPPERAEVTVTDADVTRDGEAVRVSATVGNTGSAELSGVVASVGEAEGVSPTYPQRDYFVGSVGESDFVPFELTAEVGDRETIPVEISYTDRGVGYSETVELPIEDREESETAGATDRLGWETGLGALALGAVAVAGALAWRRRRGER